MLLVFSVVWPRERGVAFPLIFNWEAHPLLNEPSDPDGDRLIRDVAIWAIRRNADSE